jgi:hypothetical protein
VSKLKILDLFAGSKSFSNTAAKLGHTTFASDLKSFDGIDYAIDVMDFDPAKVPFKPDIIWASPPCTCFSVASIGHHWLPGRMPKTQAAVLSIEIIKRTAWIIEQLNPQFYFIENPRGMLRTLPLLEHIPFLHTVTYCQYGDDRMKPTDIWTNSTRWMPKPMCKVGASCHQSAPRGARSGTQGKANAYERSKVPEALCIEIITSCLPNE